MSDKELLNDRIMVISIVVDSEGIPIGGGADKKELQLDCSYFTDLSLVSKFTTIPIYKIKGAINFSKYYEDYKSNIVKKKIGEDKFKTYIVAYESDWKGYSITKQHNRINILLSDIGYIIEK